MEGVKIPSVMIVSSVFQSTTFQSPVGPTFDDQYPQDSSPIVSGSFLTLAQVLGCEDGTPPSPRSIRPMDLLDP